MEKNFEILYIDDEQANLYSFKALLRLRYLVHTTDNTTEALNLLTLNPNIRIIFCDQKMPGEQGVEFFERIQADFPRPVRILLTAYADPQIVMDSINRGHVFRFMGKPWNEGELLSCIEEANRYYLANTLLDQRNQELVKAYDELDKFSYSVSHDLKDPLAGMMGAIKLAMEFNSVDQLHEILRLMSRSLVKLEDYIDSLRDYYLLRRGGLNLSKIDFQEVFDDILDFYKVYADASGVRIDTRVDQIHAFINDRSIIELIIHNLISNAIKYQKETERNKSIFLSVVTHPDFTVLEVIDNGIGIPQESQQIIFNLFHRASDQAHGMGFGLYNVKSAIQKLSGEITVDSELGMGSTFRVTIPTK